MKESQREIFGLEVAGVGIDAETRCAHYHGENDIIAIKFKCCGEWFSCYECHTALADHAAEVWPEKDFAQKAILCGSCGQQLSATEYFSCDSKCARCDRSFNAGCSNHRHLYFEMS